MPSPSSPSQSGCRLLLAVVVVSLSVIIATSQVDCQAAQASQSPTSSSINSTSFRSNVAVLLDALPAAAAPTGFATLSRGAGAGRAFVRGMCRGDVAPADCATYLRTAASDIARSCNDTSRRGAIWYDKCFLSYGDTNASTSNEVKFRSFRFNVAQVSDKDAFTTAYYALMRRLAARVVNGPGTGTASSPSSSAQMFATGEAVYDSNAPNGTMYGLVQCMRDRTAAECSPCLQELVPQLPACCYGNQGGVVLGYNCNLRVEIYTYYDLALDVPPPMAPAPPEAPAPSSVVVGERHGKEGSRDVALVVLLPVGTVLVAVIVLAGVLLYRRKASREKTLPDFVRGKVQNLFLVQVRRLACKL